MRKLALFGASLLALTSQITLAQEEQPPATPPAETAAPSETPAAMSGSAVGSARLGRLFRQGGSGGHRRAFRDCRRHLTGNN